MIVLIIDTSSDRALIALAKDGKLGTQSQLSKGTSLSKELLPSISEIFKKMNAVPKDLSFIAVGIGPGSYTGTRMGASLAKSLSFALGLPLIGFNSLLAFSPQKSGPFACTMQTAKGEIYLLKGVKDSNKIFNYQDLGLASSSNYLDHLELGTHVVSKEEFNVEPLITLLYEKFETTQDCHVSFPLDLIYLHSPS